MASAHLLTQWDLSKPAVQGPLCTVCSMASYTLEGQLCSLEHSARRADPADLYHCNQTELPPGSCKWHALTIKAATTQTGAQGRNSDPHNLALLLQHLESCQFLHVVLPCAVIKHLLGAVNETTQAVALAKGPPLHVASTAHPL